MNRLIKCGAVEQTVHREKFRPTDFIPEFYQTPEDSGLILYKAFHHPTHFIKLILKSDTKARQDNSEENTNWYHKLNTILNRVLTVEPSSLSEGLLTHYSEMGFFLEI